MEKDIQTLAKNFMEKGYEVYLRGKSKDLEKLFNEDQPLGLLLAETSHQIENLKKLQALGEQNHNNRAIKDELKELEGIKSNFKTLRDDLRGGENPREAINDFLGKEDNDGKKTFADLIKSLVYKIFPKKYESDKKKITDGIISDLTKIQAAQESLNKEVKSRQKPFLNNPAEKVNEIISSRIDALSEIKDNLVKVAEIRPRAEIEPGGKAFHENSLEPGYQKRSNNNTSVMQEILQINREISELQKVSYRFAKLEDRLTNKEKPAVELFDELKNKLEQTKTENVVVKQVSTLLSDLSEGKNTNVLHGFKQLQESQKDLSQKAAGLKESSKSLTNEIERTNRKESTRRKVADYDNTDSIFSKLQGGTAFQDMRNAFKKHGTSHSSPEAKVVIPRAKDKDSKNSMRRG